MIRGSRLGGATGAMAVAMFVVAATANAQEWKDIAPAESRISFAGGPLAGAPAQRPRTLVTRDGNIEAAQFTTGNGIAYVAYERLSISNAYYDFTPNTVLNNNSYFKQNKFTPKRSGSKTIYRFDMRYAVVTIDSAAAPRDCIAFAGSRSTEAVSGRSEERRVGKECRL